MTASTSGLLETLAHVFALEVLLALECFGLLGQQDPSLILGFSHC